MPFEDEPEMPEPAPKVEWTTVIKAAAKAEPAQVPSPPVPDEDYTGQPSQWARFGTGFIPMTDTYARLSPGIYRIVQTSDGNFFDPQTVVTDNLLRLPDSKSDQVISEFETFWTLKDRFKHFGFNFKRGVLLWGPPGSGKTATLAFIQQQVVKTGGLVIIGNLHPWVLTNMLQKLRRVEPERPLVVIFEDLDTIIKEYGETQVLALLDGDASVSNVVFLATTNYPEELDGRVRNRPSRFDSVVHIGMPSPEARRMYLEHVKAEGDLDEWVALTEGYSIAHLKEVVIGVCCFGRPLKDTITKLDRMIKKPIKNDHGTADNKMGFGS